MNYWTIPNQILGMSECHQQSSLVPNGSNPSLLEVDLRKKGKKKLRHLCQGAVSFPTIITSLSSSLRTVLSRASVLKVLIFQSQGTSTNLETEIFWEPKKTHQPPLIVLSMLKYVKCILKCS